MTTFFAEPRGVILEKLNGMAAVRAPSLKYGTRFPVTTVLSRAFHGMASFILYDLSKGASSIFRFLKRITKNNNFALTYVKLKGFFAAAHGFLLMTRDGGLGEIP